MSDRRRRTAICGIVWSACPISATDNRDRHRYRSPRCYRVQPCDSKGSVQFENGITWTKTHGGQVLDFSETLLRVGLLNRTEIRLVLPNYLADLRRSSPTSGLGDIAIGAKQQLGPLPGHLDLSVIVALSLPTGAARVSSHGFDPFVKFPWSKDLRNGWSIGGMQSLFWNTQDAKRNLTWEATFNFEKEITNRCSMFVEYAGDFPHLSGSQQIAHLGTAYRITRNQQIDSHFGFGLSESSLGRFFALGYSIRFDKGRNNNTDNIAERR